MRISVLALVLCLFLAGCRDQHLKVMADPWLADIAGAQIALFEEAHPELPPPELKILSTEFILQHIRHGNPVDAVFVIDAGYPEWEPEAGFFSDRHSLGGDRVCWVQVAENALQQTLKSDSCLLLAPADSPLRRIGREWKPGIGQKEGSCVFFPQMQELMEKYLEEGWVKWGIVWESFAASKDQLKILSSGPFLDDLYWSAVTKTSQNPVLAADFLDFSKVEN